MSLTLPYPTLGPGVVNSQELTSNFTVLSDKFGLIDNDDIKSTANIDVTKLSASYEYVTVNLVHVSSGTAGMHTVGRVLATAPMYNDSKGTWTAVNYTWHCSNCGAKTGAFTLRWGYYDAAGAFQTTSTLKSGELLDGGTADTHYQDGAALGTSLAWTQSAMILRLEVATADTTAMDTNGVANTNDYLSVAVLLRRQITSA